MCERGQIKMKTLEEIDAIRKNVYTRHNILEYKNAYDYDKYILYGKRKE